MNQMALVFYANFVFKEVDPILTYIYICVCVTFGKA